MATLYFVRHGQASFGAENYDQLSPLGANQASALGQYWAARGLRFDAMVRGSLKRHEQTLQSLLLGPETQEKHENTAFVQYPRHLVATNNIAIQTTTSLNEYDSEALIHARLARHPQELPSATTPEGYKAHFRVLRDALLDWIEGRCTPVGMPSFTDFRGGIAQVMDDVRTEHGAHGKANILVVSSGGPIATAVMHALGAPAEAMVDLNYQMRNTAVTSFQVSRSKVSLAGFNHLPHLDALDKPSWVTST